MLPSQKELEIPLLQVLVELGGQAYPKDLYSLVAQKFPDVPETEFEQLLSSGGIRWRNRVQFTRQRLKEKGEIDSPDRGVWRITQKGRERILATDENLNTEDPKHLKGVLITDKDLQDTARIRKNKKIQRVVPKEDVQRWINDGYSVELEFSRSVRVSKSKPIGEQFENEIWLLLKQLGFSTLNHSREFYIDVSIPSEEPRWEQIDVFAKDGDDHVFIIECKCSEKLSDRHRSLKAAIDNFKANDSRIRDAVRKYFNDDKTKRLKVTYVIATRNINWSENNLRRADSSNIFVWKDEDVDRLAELARLHSLIGNTVRFQLYASMFRRQDIKSLDNQQVAAIKGKAGNYTYYQFIATPEQLLPIAFIHRRGEGAGHKFDFEELKHSYQRMLRKTKVKAIGEFIDQRKYFPNNIIISFEEEPRFTFAPGHQNFAFQSGTLTLPNKYGSAWIIDGQHRLYGFANSKKGSSDPIPVIAFRNLDVSEQAKLFIEINKNQTNVDSNLLWDLYGDIYSGTEDDSQREELTISNVVKLLGTMKGSPFLNHIFIPSQGRKNKQRNLTMSTLCQGIKRNRLISVDMLGRGKQGKEQTKFEEFAAKRIAAFFGVVEKLYPEDWKRGEKGYLRTNNGISAFLIIFRRILRHLNSHEKFIYAKVDISEFEDEVDLLLLPAIQYLRQTKDRPVEFRRRSGQSGQQESAEELINQIKKEHPDYFLVPVIDSGIQGKLPTEKIEDTPSLDDIIKDTELRLRSFVLANLRLIHGDAWFRIGIPGGVKKQINSYMEDEIRKHPYRESELRNNLDHRLEFSSLGQLKDIIIYAENWSYFEGIFKAQNNVEIYFTDFKDLRNAYRGHMRHVDPVLMNRGRAAITWIQRCVEMAGY